MVGGASHRGRFRLRRRPLARRSPKRAPRHTAEYRGLSPASALFLIAGLVLLAVQGCGDAAATTGQAPGPSFDEGGEEEVFADGIVAPDDTIPAEGHGSRTR